MAKNTDALRAEERHYSKSDYRALRAYCMRMPLKRIAQIYYSQDSEALSAGLESFFIGMLDRLIEHVAARDPGLAQRFTLDRQGGNLSPHLVDMLVQAASLPESVPSPADKTSLWFRPLTVRMLGEEGIATLGDLSDLIAERGPSWWRSIPRIGQGRAEVIGSWLRRNAAHLGDLPTLPTQVVRPAAVVQLDPAAGQLAPLGTFVLPPELDGHDGANRCTRFSFIAAKDDLAAVECYLARFSNRPHTLRAYRRELERFVLWCALVARKPLSSLLADDCEAYKCFLEDPAPAFRGKTAPRSSKLWRPFTNEAMRPGSVKAALQVLRAAFDYLVKVRYLAGTPWEVICDPVVEQDVNEIQIEKALSVEGWEALVNTLQRRCEVREHVQDRVALAAILLMGDSGLRRHEAATAQRHKLTRSRFEADLWMLNVLGKRSAKRDVPVSARTIAALRAHWTDLGLDFGQAVELPLLSPVIIPQTEAARSKHGNDDPRGYRSSSLYNLVKAALKRVRRDLEALGQNGVPPEISVEDIEQFKTTSPHAFRHTFGTQAVANDMPVTVVQGIMGHKDSATTAIYVREKEKRMAAEAVKYFQSFEKKS